MSRNAMTRNLQQSIRRSLGRYMAIMAIIALGSSIFVGLRMTKADMVATGQVYTDEQNMFDIRLVSTYGWSEEQVEKASQLDGVEDAEGQYYMDLIMSTGAEGAEGTYRLYTIPERINLPVLVGGRMPEKPDECLIDGYHMDDSILGTVYTLSGSNDPDSLELVTAESFTVVGYISSPLYIDMNRGTTSVGNGSLTNYFLVPKDAFDVDYYTEIQLTIPGEYAIYSEEYNDALEKAIEELEPQTILLAQERFDQVRADAEVAYAEGLEEYTQGLQELNDAKIQVAEELEKALFELQEGEQKIIDSEAALRSAEQQLAAGKKEFEEGKAALDEMIGFLETQRDQALALVDQQEELIGDVDAQIKIQLDTVNAGIAATDASLTRADNAIKATTGMSAAELGSKISQRKSTIAELESSLSQAREDKNYIKALRLEGELAVARGELAALQTVYSPYGSLLAAKSELLATKAQLEAGNSPFIIDAAYIENQRRIIQEAHERALGLLGDQIKQVEDAEKQILAAQTQITNGWTQLNQGKKDLEEGWLKYEEGKLEAEQEIADAEAKLEEGWLELVDGREQINSMEKVEQYLLDRSTNIGYNSLNSSSDIVAGVSRVFPVFFLLVAALVCITTMTRMVDEERTQIGTLKALGYSNGAIISKYIFYAVSGAVIGCGLGVVLGSVIFPLILWEAYKIMLFIPHPLVLTIDWMLCLSVVAMYTAAILTVTWYCCYKTLQEVPAELIRPKPPAVGKRLVFELLPLWNRISFLNKVTIRNIFRYRQRLAMMMVGVGGCTALLLTGFGLRDSIVNIVDFQFNEVTVYDMSVYFAEGQSDLQQDVFTQKLRSVTEDVLFYHQVSVELDGEDMTKEIYLISADQRVSDFIDFHQGDEDLSYPGPDQVLLSVGCAEAMNIRVGDRVTMRNSDMDTMELTVSGIYDNHVYNYALVSPATIEKQWGAPPEMQMAFIKISPDQDAYSVTARITDMDDVMNVSVSADLASMVRNMMDALDLVVIVIVICAALLAAIVLYNLTNININERIREIATIKVLGFRAGETAMYIFKENLTLSVMGAGFGLLLGRLLLEFVMGQIKIDMVWFQARALYPSYIWSVVLTILTALIVDYIFYFKLEKINMAEALKSLE